MARIPYSFCFKVFAININATIPNSGAISNIDGLRIEVPKIPCVTDPNPGDQNTHTTATTTVKVFSFKSSIKYRENTEMTRKRK